MTLAYYSFILIGYCHPWFSKIFNFSPDTEEIGFNNVVV
jgi:hypothetical protein